MDLVFVKKDALYFMRGTESEIMNSHKHELKGIEPVRM